MSSLVAIDSNILVYSVNEQSIFYKQSKKLLESNKIEKAVAWQNLVEFFAVTTDKRRFPIPLSPTQAKERIKEILSSDALQVIAPNGKTGFYFLKLSGELKPMSQKIYDVFLAATLLSNGVTRIVTENTNDFLRIKDLTTFELGSFEL